jgi:L-2-hydroxyglutarate oxidase LhgO
VATGRVDVAVIGAGVVGLAVGRALAAQGLDTAVLERNPRPGQETSSRHSGVLHAGLYYPTGSLKARLCVEGRRALVAFCQRHDVPHAVCGKVIVATSEAEEAELQRLHAQGLDNGVEGLERITGAQVRQREPSVRATAGLLSAATAIVSSDDLVAALERSLLARGGLVLPGNEVVALQPTGDHWTVTVQPLRGEAHSFEAGQVVNAAGLAAAAVARLAGEDDLQVHYCRGDYFWTTRPVVRGLVYPVPEPGLRGLGVHTTVDLAGRIRFGPDTTWIDDIAYDVDPSKAPAFAAALARYLDGIDVADLQPDTSGIRPKLTRDDRFTDFLLRRGPSGLVTLAGIESPGLTSCLALGREVADLIRD